MPLPKCPDPGVGLRLSGLHPGTMHRSLHQSLLAARHRCGSACGHDQATSCPAPHRALPLIEPKLCCQAYFVTEHGTEGEGADDEKGLADLASPRSGYSSGDDPQRSTSPRSIFGSQASHIHGSPHCAVQAH